MMQTMNARFAVPLVPGDEKTEELHRAVTPTNGFTQESRMTTAELDAAAHRRPALCSAAMRMVAMQACTRSAAQYGGLHAIDSALSTAPRR